LLCFVALLGCANGGGVLPRSAPVVKQQHFAKGRDALNLLAVMPFSSKLSITRSRDDTTLSETEATELLTRFFAEASMSAGIQVVPALDLEIAFEAEGIAVPQFDPRLAARLATKHFGATTILLGELLRFRDRVGERMGASRAASVSFQVTLYEAPSGFKLWSARFDETQQPLSDNLFNARRYPGGGSRWLTSTELVQWGAQEVAKALANRP
jgi:hypothetical protein